MSVPKVCILTAGRGTRMGHLGDWVNKALLPLQNQAVISHIISKFPQGTEFVIALGHRSEQVRAYLELAHPDLRFHFVSVDRIEGPGSGPGYSLQQCHPFLKDPFYFVSCDTLWNGTEHLRTNVDWVGTAPVDSENSERYCNFEVKEEAVLRIADKERVSTEGFRSFVGLCFVKNVAAFWKGLSSSKSIGDELQISGGLDEIRRSGPLLARTIDWTDVGTEKDYRQALSKEGKFDFSKSQEHFYLVRDRVLKLFSSEALAKKRFERAEMNPAVFPELIGQREGFLCYKLAAGRTLYQLRDPALFPKLLEWLDRELWKPVQVDETVLKKACSDFYRRKTEERLGAYRRKYGAQQNPLDRAVQIQGKPVKSVNSLLKKIPWAELDQGAPVFFHGDLQFDNVLYDPAGGFKLIDWRQDFGGNLSFGDLYYDLAKLRGGIHIDYYLVHAGKFSYRESDTRIEFQVPEAQPKDWYLRTLDEFTRAKGLDERKVRILMGLIYLNMSPLHQPPFDQLVFAYGNLILDQELA